MEKIIYNLHNHTSCSDGELTINELIDLNKKHGIKFLSITDHNTINAYKQLKEYSDITIIPGIEFDSKEDYEIVGLNVDINYVPLIEYTKKCEYSIELALENNIKLINEYYGTKMTLAKIRESDNRTMLTKRKLSMLCYKLYPDIFKKNDSVKNFLATIDKSKKVNIEYKSIKEIITLIHNASGYAILPHPLNYFKYWGFIKYIRLYQFLKLLKSYGLDGLETQRSDAHLYQDVIVSIIAKKLELFQSGGSDFHMLNDKDPYKWFNKKSKKSQLYLINTLLGGKL